MTSRQLLDYLPSILRDAAELITLVDKAEQPEIDELWGRAGLLWNEQFIETASASSLSRWERMMGLPSAASMEERRDAILRRLREIPPFTLKELIALLEEMCGADRVTVDMDYGGYRLTVRLAPDGPFPAVQSLLIRRLPANILMDLDFYYIRHIELRPLRHSELAARTHIRIREDV